MHPISDNRPEPTTPPPGRSGVSDLTIDGSWRREPPAFWGPGLYYVESTDQHAVPTIYQLGRRPTPTIPRPERDVLVALLRYAVERLEAQEDTP